MVDPQIAHPEHYRVDAGAVTASLPAWVVPGVEIRCAFCGRLTDADGHVYVNFAAGISCMSPGPDNRAGQASTTTS